MRSAMILKGPRMVALRLCRILAIAVLVMCAGQTNAQVNAEQVLAIGRNVLSMDDYMLAIQYFNQAIKAKPYLADAYFYRGIAKLNLDDFKGAEEDCSLAIERNRFKPEPYKVRGYARQQMNMDSLAILDYDKGLEYNPQDRQFLFYKAIALTELKRYESADSTFRTLRRLYPKFPEGLTAYAHLKLERGDTISALEDIEQTINLSLSQLNPYLMRAEINSKRGLWEDALADMDQAIRLQPDASGLYLNRAYMRYNNDDYFGAMADYNYAIDLEPENTAALFNRGLLRFEVRELDNAATDFSKVLALEPDNFHARYNRALVFMKMSRPAKALSDFQIIATKYPRFYPVYYAMAQCRQEQGDMRGAVAFMKKGDELVRKYVEDPKHHQLDRPTIDRRANDKANNVEEDEIEIMEKFNRLVTSSKIVDTKLSYNEKIKGRVQDRNVTVDPEPAYSLSMKKPEQSLSNTSNYFRELDDINQQRFVPNTIYLVSGNRLNGESEIKEAFRLLDSYSSIIANGEGRPVDYLIRGILHTELKNYESAIEDFDKALETAPDFIVANMGRGYAYMCRAANSNNEARMQESNTENQHSLSNSTNVLYTNRAIADFDIVLKNNPRQVFAWFNKGNIMFALEDLTSALQCYANAIAVNPDFGQAYFNRGLVYLKMGDRVRAFSDLSKAGELGVLPSYNILKRMK